MVNKGLRDTPKSMVNSQSFEDNYDKIFSGKVQRGRFRQDPETRKFISADEYNEKYGNQSADAGYYVIEDMSEYKSPLDGSMVGSRSAHRAHMREHGVIEVGNEKLKEAKRSYNPQKGEIEQDLMRTMRELS